MFRQKWTIYLFELQKRFNIDWSWIRPTLCTISTLTLRLKFSALKTALGFENVLYDDICIKWQMVSPTHQFNDHCNNGRAWLLICISLENFCSCDVDPDPLTVCAPLWVSLWIWVFVSVWLQVTLVCSETSWLSSDFKLQNCWQYCCSLLFTSY